MKKVVDVSVLSLFLFWYLFSPYAIVFSTEPAMAQTQAQADYSVTIVPGTQPETWQKSVKQQISLLPSSYMLAAYLVPASQALAAYTRPANTRDGISLAGRNSNVQQNNSGAPDTSFLYASSTVQGYFIGMIPANTSAISVSAHSFGWVPPGTYYLKLLKGIECDIYTTSHLNPKTPTALIEGTTCVNPTYFSVEPDWAVPQNNRQRIFSNNNDPQLVSRYIQDTDAKPTPLPVSAFVPQQTSSNRSPVLIGQEATKQKVAVLSATSPSPITITAAPLPSMVVTSPNSGDSWSKSGVHEVTWLSNFQKSYYNNSGIDAYKGIDIRQVYGILPPKDVILGSGAVLSDLEIQAIETAVSFIPVVGQILSIVVEILDFAGVFGGSQPFAVPVQIEAVGYDTGTHSLISSRTYNLGSSYVELSKTRVKLTKVPSGIYVIRLTAKLNDQTRITAVSDPITVTPWFVDTVSQKGKEVSYFSQGNQMNLQFNNLLSTSTATTVSLYVKSEDTGAKTTVLSSLSANTSQLSVLKNKLYQYSWTIPTSLPSGKYVAGVSVNGTSVVEMSRDFVIANTPEISAVSLQSSSNGTQVTITGGGFTANGNTINIASSTVGKNGKRIGTTKVTLNNVSSADGSTLVFTLPVFSSQALYTVTVANAGGKTGAPYNLGVTTLSTEDVTESDSSSAAAAPTSQFVTSSSDDESFDETSIDATVDTTSSSDSTITPVVPSPSPTPTPVSVTDVNTQTNTASDTSQNTSSAGTAQNMPVLTPVVSNPAPASQLKVTGMSCIYRTGRVALSNSISYLLKGTPTGGKTPYMYAVTNTPNGTLSVTPNTSKTVTFSLNTRFDPTNSYATVTSSDGQKSQVLCVSTTRSNNWADVSTASALNGFSEWLKDIFGW